MKWCWVGGAAVAGVLLPDTAWAWGPAAHLTFGLDILSRLDQLAAGLRSLLAAQPLPFLYGCVSADIVLAKRLGRRKTHSHAWRNALRLLREASNPRLHSYALGYGAHLAADTISHNCFVPAKSIESYASGPFPHVLWELRFDRRIATAGTFQLMKEIARGEFPDCDDHFSERVPVRILDFPFNKRVFNRLLQLQGIRRWQLFWDGVARRGFRPLADPEVRIFQARSVDAIENFLQDGERSRYLATDPNGRERLKAAHRLRRHYRRRLRGNVPVKAGTVLQAAESFRRDPFAVLDVERTFFADRSRIE